MFLALWCLLTAGSYLQLRYSIRVQLENHLQAILPPRIKQGGASKLIEADYADYVITRITEEFSRIKPQGLMPYTRVCKVTPLDFQRGSYTYSAAERSTITLYWQESQPVSLSLDVTCDYNLLTITGIQALLALLATALISIIQAPLGANRQALCNRLVELGTKPAAARREVLLSEVSDDQLTWFEAGLTVSSNAVVPALAIARSATDIAFHPETTSVCCHGITIKLPSTPFFYFLWYAQRRKSKVDDGWFTNPRTNQPDKSSAQELVSLLQRYSGNAKAIRELSEKGLRAKVLDQNRSKIKDELTDALGETLASNYLFEQQWNIAKYRNRYRIATEPEHIILP